MRTADYLFPRDLEVTPVKLGKVLFIGSCLSEFYAQQFQRLQPGLEVEHVMFNNAYVLPARDDIASFDVQYIQLPLRSVLSDGIIRHHGGAAIDWLAVGKANIDAMLAQALAYTRHGILTVVSNFVVPQGKLGPSLYDQDSGIDYTRVIAELNFHLADALKPYQNVYLADVNMIASTMGKKFFLDDTVYFFTHNVAISLDDFLVSEGEHSLPAPNRLDGAMHLVQRYDSRADEYYEAVYRQVIAIYRTVRQIDQVKLVIFDLDNTLWRGQIGEHYEPGSEWPKLHGWPTGVWDAVNQLRRRGIVCSLASKNDEATVIQKWRWAMPLGMVNYEDFLVPKINWEPKAQNIAQIMEALSLTAISTVFVDDNPVERDSVAAALPGIRVIGHDPYSIKRLLTWAPETQIARLSAESAQREASLQNKVKRDEQRAAMPRAEFLASLGTEVELTEIGSTDHPSFYRVSELVNKTNQFNTTGARRALDDYHHHWSQGGRVFAFTVKDKYSDYGLVGVLFSLSNCITQYVMSCRVLGMEIEIAVLRAVTQRLQADLPEAAVSGLVLHTEKNTPSRSVFADTGYSATGNPQFFMVTTPLPETAGVHVQIRWV
ncbi:HAD-IIIC family phosphatase [Oxalobacteraceae bacterium A2-2]